MSIQHIEDLPLKDFLDTVEKLKDKVITEKLDGSNLWFGYDDKGFFTSREGKRANQGRFYSVGDYPLIGSYNGFRAAHAALQEVEPVIRKILQPEELVEVEVIFGEQPNTVVYGAGGKNYVVILRGIGTDPNKVDMLAQKLNKQSVTIHSIVVSSPDGDKLNYDDESQVWEFTQVTPLANKKLESSEVTEKLGELKRYLQQSNDVFPDKTNEEVAEIKLTSVDKALRDEMKLERVRLLAYIQTTFKIPIKELLLNNFVRKVKPRLQKADKLDPSEDVGVEGVVISDRGSDKQVKIVDKDVFTAINTFNNFIRGNISGLVRTDDQDAPIELRGGAFGQAKIRIANLLGMKELAVSSSSKKIISKFKGATPEETAEKMASSIQLESLDATKTKIAAILKNAVIDVNDTLEKFKAEADTYKLKLKTGKEIGLTAEVMKRNLTAFAETKRDIYEIERAVLKSQSVTDLVMALYGRTIQSLFDGSNDVKESFNLLKIISEDGDAVPAGVPAAAPSGALEGAPALQGTTTSSSIAAFQKPLFKGKKTIQKRKRTFVQKKKFAMTTESLMKLVELDVSNQNATDVDDSAAANRDIEFKQLRNNVNINNDVNDNDVNRYLDKAHELNDEVDTVTFGLEMDDGSIAKVYVNANQADGFEDALAKMLGEYDDVEEVINNLASTFDIVDVEWPKNSEQAQASEDPGRTADGADRIDTKADSEPEVNPVIDLGDETSPSDEPVQPSKKPEDMTIDNTFFDDGNTDQDDGRDDTGSEPAPTEPGEEGAEEDGRAEPSTEADDEIVGGEEGKPEEEESSEEEPVKKPKKKPETKTEESFMTSIGNKFKQKLLEDKANQLGEGVGDPEEGWCVVFKNRTVEAGPFSDKKKAVAQRQHLIDGDRYNDNFNDESLRVRFGKKSSTHDEFVSTRAVEESNGKKTFVVSIRHRAKNGSDWDTSYVTIPAVTDAAHAKRVAEIEQFHKLKDPKITRTVEKKPTTESSSLGSKFKAKVMGEGKKDASYGSGAPKDAQIADRNFTDEGYAEAKKLYDKSEKAKATPWDELTAVQQDFWAKKADRQDHRDRGVTSESYGSKFKAKVMGEAKNELGETEYETFPAWKRAVKKQYPDVWFEGDIDIAQAMVGPKPYVRGETRGVGEWDGVIGVIYKNVKVAEDAKDAIKITNRAEFNKLTSNLKCSVVGDLYFYTEKGRFLGVWDKEEGCGVFDPDGMDSATGITKLLRSVKQIKEDPDGGLGEPASVPVSNMPPSSAPPTTQPGPSTSTPPAANKPASAPPTPTTGANPAVVRQKKIQAIKSHIASVDLDDASDDDVDKVYQSLLSSKSIQPITEGVINALSDSALDALHEMGIYFSSKPSHFEHLEEKSGHYKPINEMQLSRAEKKLGGKFAHLTASEVYGRNPTGPLADYKKKPTQETYVIQFSDGRKYLCDRTGANSYTRLWILIK